MPLPDLDPDGYLPPGIHAASTRVAQSQFAVGADVRQRQGELLRQVVEAAAAYPTIKRILLWGSFVTAKAEPVDLDYSVVVSVMHHRVQIAPEHRRFFVPQDARRHYGVDRAYLVIRDYPPEEYAERLDFLCRRRGGLPRGIVEISLRGESIGDEP